MERTYSQETEAPLSDGAYDMLMEGLETEGNIRGNSIFQQQNHYLPGQLIKNEETSQNTTTEATAAPLSFMPVNFPPCAQGFKQALPALARTYSFEKHNNIPANPSRVDYRGIYNFNLMFDGNRPVSKSIPWTYSERLRKLFCQIGTGVPIKFQTKDDTPRGAYVRALVVARGNDTDIICTCPKHVEELRKKGNQNVTHLLQCHGPNAAYGICQKTQRHSVRFPLLPCQAGVDYQLEVFRFHCFTSCLRKEIEAIFTLELNGEVLGRRTIGVRVCACPGRDRQTLEKKDISLKRDEARAHKRSLSSSEEDRKKIKRAQKKVGAEQERWVVLLSSKEKVETIKALWGESSATHSIEQVVPATSWTFKDGRGSFLWQ